MKRVLLSTGLALFLTQFSAPAQDSGRAAAYAEQQRSEERYTQMKSDIEQLREANASLQRKVSSLEEALQKSREEQARRANDSSVQDDMKKLAESIQAVDKKRENDKQVISEEIKKSSEKTEQLIRKYLASGGGSTHTPTTTIQTPPETDVPQGETFTYVIKANNTLGAIVQAYNEKFKEKGWKTITRKQVMEANPKVNWDRLLIGQKVLIPKPPGAN